MRYLPFALVTLLLATPALAAETPATPPAAAPLPAPAVPGPEGAAAPGEAAATDAALPPSWVYMVVRVKLADTDITQVAFLRHAAITTLEACEQERSAGMMQGWRYYNRYYFKTLKGTSYKVDFRCVEGRQYLAAWRPGDRVNRYYLVRTSDGQLQAQPQESFFACRHALRAVTATEGIDAFCGVASQAITEPPAEPAEDDAMPAQPAEANIPAAPVTPPRAPGPGALPWADAPTR